MKENDENVHEIISITMRVSDKNDARYIKYDNLMHHLFLFMVIMYYIDLFSIKHFEQYLWLY